MNADVTVVTPSVPGRGFVLRCIGAVDIQAVRPAAHLVGFDHARSGHGARVRNQLMRAAETTWIACCDDDDWFLPDHLELLMQAASHSGADVVVAEYRLETGGWQPAHECDPSKLEVCNWVHPSSVLLRREAALAAGGFPDPRPPLWDDWALLLNMHRAGARFECVHKVTNVKGVHAGCINGPRE